MTSCSKELRQEPTPKRPLQITTRAPRGPDFKFELMPLHSPLLRQSLLVSFPPLIDMLKFSGYPYLIRGQSDGGCSVVARALCPRRNSAALDSPMRGPPMDSGRVRPGAGQTPNNKLRLRGFYDARTGMP